MTPPYAKDQLVEAEDVVRILVLPDQLTSKIELPPLSKEVFAYWCSKQADNRTPRRSKIDPIDLRGALPNLILWEVTHPDLDIRCRVAGTMICEMAGREIRGMSVEALHWDQPEKIRREFISVVETGCLHYVERSMLWTKRPFRRYRRLLMPLLGRGKDIEYLLGCIDLD